jgi:predicted transcriptional regulator
LGLSKLEKYIAILKVLDSWGSLSQKQIMQKAELNLASPKEYLSFLVRLDLVREENIRTKTVYSITTKGQKLFAYFGLRDDKRIFAKHE